MRVHFLFRVLVVVFIIAVVMVVCAAAAAAVGMSAPLFNAVLEFSVGLSIATIPICIRNSIPCRTGHARRTVVLLRSDVSSTASAASMHPRGEGGAAHEHSR
jgi:hypothetical protein